MKLRISELFHSLQGEGPSAGTPAHFLRLQGCDVGCAWCDSKYTWDAAGGEERSLDDVFAALASTGRAELLVVTGGEPLAHADMGGLLAAALERWARVEVETSGLAPPPLRHARLHYNHSPKLPAATPRWRETWAHAAEFVADPNTTFKIVVGDPPDEDDALRLVAGHALPRERTMLMPEGLTDAVVRARATALATTCRREGLRLSPRLHVWLWGAKRGV
ncbi:MAG TPA: 7-carboxy-7-deazaguanine synthase QueE [Candidatus Acidoferrales bacterium]|nr:7-carboxy-7-deazaguanine synthase QueE [Candidatus Acidoferrales bacterium]